MRLRYERIGLTRSARCFIAVFLLSSIVFTDVGAFGQDRVLLRISTENSPSHFQTQALRRFSELAASRLGSSLQVEFYDGARLYRDVDALAALARGELEMAAPGVWQFDRMVPDLAVLTLPSMYARPRQAIHAVVDGPVGASLVRDLESTLPVRVLGAWLDLGYAHVFSGARRISSTAELRGHKIRVAGGKGNEERIRALGAEPISIPLLDLPSYLSLGLVDGVLTTYETVDSSGLDRAGLTAALEDSQYYAFYVPLISKRFWDKLDANQRSALRNIWAEVVAGARLQAAEAQDDAKSRLVSRGLAVKTQTETEARATRTALMAVEEDMARRLNVRPETLAALRRALAAAGAR